MLVTHRSSLFSYLHYFYAHRLFTERSAEEEKRVRSKSKIHKTKYISLISKMCVVTAQLDSGVSCVCFVWRTRRMAHVAWPQRSPKHNQAVLVPKLGSYVEGLPVFRSNLLGVF